MSPEHFAAMLHACTRGLVMLSLLAFRRGSNLNTEIACAKRWLRLEWHSFRARCLRLMHSGHSRMVFILLAVAWRFVQVVLGTDMSSHFGNVAA